MLSGVIARTARIDSPLARPPQPNWTLSGRWVDHCAALGDLQLTAGDHAAGGSSGRFHKIAPFLAADRLRRIGWTDRRGLRPGSEQRDDRFFQPEIGCGDPAVTTRIRTVLHRIPVARPLRPPLDPAPTRRTGLLRAAIRRGRIGPLTVRHASCRAPARVRG